MSKTLICPIHQVPMEPPVAIDAYGEKYRRGHTCPICAAKAFARVSIAKKAFRKHGYGSLTRRTPLPPAPPS